MEHFAECLKEQADMKIAHDKWIEKWPNHCKKCCGHGLYEWVEMHDALGGERMAEPCSCLLEGKCPRCGGVYTDENCEKACSICGWNFDDECPIEKMDGPCECAYIENDFGVKVSGNWVDVDDDTVF